jgi:hypothetical protein
VIKSKKLTPRQQALRAAAEKGPTAYEGFREERDARATEARRAKKAKKHKPQPPNPYKALEAAVASDDKEAVRKAMSKLSDYYKDLLVDCRECGAAERKPCIDVVPESKWKVHYARRLRRVLEGIR